MLTETGTGPPQRLDGPRSYRPIIPNSAQTPGTRLEDTELFHSDHAYGPYQNNDDAREDQEDREDQELRNKKRKRRGG